MSAFRAIGVLLAVACQAQGAGVPPHRRWEAIGPYHSSVRHLAVDPRDPDTAYAAGEILAGILRTKDGGLTWAEVRKGLGQEHPQINGLLVDPHEANTVYAGTNRGVFRSTDGGGSWGLHCADFQVCGPFDRSAGKTGRFYAGERWDLCASDDGCRTWQVVRKFDYVTCIASHPGRAEVLLVGDGARLYVTDDGGKSWQGSEVGLGLVGAAAASPSYASVLYAGTQIGGTAHGDFYRSSDGGKSWSRITLLPEAEALKRSLQVFKIAATSGKPSRVFAATSAGLFVGAEEGTGLRFEPEARLAHRRVFDLAAIRATKRLYAATDNGVYVSRDLGGHWSVHFTGFPCPSIRRTIALPGPGHELLAVGDGQLHVRRGDTWEILRDRIYSLAVGGSKRGILYAGGDGGVVKSSDRGATWQPCLKAREHLTIMDIASAQHDLYVVGLRGEFLHSLDQGATWRESSLRLNKDLTVSELCVDPKDPARVYVGLQPAGAWNVAGRAPAPPGKFSVQITLPCSQDGGKTWHGVPQASEEVVFRPGLAAHVAGSGAPGHVLYAATILGRPTEPAAVARSLDGGRTWEAFGDQSAMGRIQCLAVDPQDPRVAYAGSGEGRVFVTRDAGETWTPLGEKLDRWSCNILVRPNAENALYLATDGGIHRRDLE